MKAREFITEKEGQLPKRYKKVARGISTFHDKMGAASAEYTQYRVGLAVACADGSTPLNVDAESWIGKQKTAHPYSKLEQEMLDQAYKAVGAAFHDLNSGADFDSKELDNTNTLSPVAQWNKK